MKLSSKTYSRLLDGLEVLGNFSGKIEVDFYDRINHEKEQKIRLWCTDADDNLFIFYGFSSNRKDGLRITKETNDGTFEYDLSLAKKFKLNTDNVNFTKTGQSYDFKFGRLITDRNNFYSLFLGDDIGYQIQGDLNADIVNELLSELNKLSSTPKLTDYLNIFKDILATKSIHFSTLSISAFKSFENVGFFQINGEEPKSLILKNEG